MNENQRKKINEEENVAKNKAYRVKNNMAAQQIVNVYSIRWRHQHLALARALSAA